MKRRFHLPCPLPEGIATLFGGIIVAVTLGLLVPLAAPASVALITSPLTRDIGLILAIVGGIALLYGLFRGFLRHGNGTPLMLAFIGAVCLSLSVSTYGSQALSLLGAAAVLSAIPWSIFQKTLGRLQTEEPVLDLETFLNGSRF